MKKVKLVIAWAVVGVLGLYVIAALGAALVLVASSLAGNKPWAWGLIPLAAIGGAGWLVVWSLNTIDR